MNDQQQRMGTRVEVELDGALIRAFDWPGETLDDDVAFARVLAHLAAHDAGLVADHPTIRLMAMTIPMRWPTPDPLDGWTEARR